MGIEGELEVPEVEGVAELEGIPKEPKSPLLGSLRAGNWKSKCNTHPTSNTLIPAVKVKSSSS